MKRRSLFHTLLASLWPWPQSLSSTAQGWTASTSALGGSLLTLGTGTSTTVSVPGARPGMAVIVTPQSDPGLGLYWDGWVSANDVVTVRIVAIVGLTPASVVYNVRVIP